MPFQVYELGRRIETPWQSIFPPRSVDKLQELASSEAISPNDQVKESQLPHQQARSLKTLKDIQSPTQQQRRPVYLAAQIMKKPVITLPLSATMEQAQEQFERHGFRHFPVTDRQGVLHGLVSDRDLLSATSPLTSGRHVLQTTARAASIMRTQVLTATGDTNLRYLAEVMLAHHVGSMPILNQEGQLEGMVTRSDILRTITHQVPIELWS